MASQGAAPRPYDPLWNEGRTAARRPGGTKVAVAFSILAHAALGYAVYELKIAPNYPQQSDQPVTAILFDPPKPPPPKPQTQRPEPPPPTKTLDIRQSPVPPTLLPTVPSVVFPEPPPTLPAEPVAEPVAERPPPPPVITNPNWSSQPSGEDMARYYPERAQRLERGGAVTLECRVMANGSVSGCTVASETPSDFGFGDAAMKLARLFKMRPKTQDGRTVEGAMVRIPITFRIG